eukprot:EG_transcript_47141
MLCDYRPTAYFGHPTPLRACYSQISDVMFDIVGIAYEIKSTPRLVQTTSASHFDNDSRAFDRPCHCRAQTEIFSGSPYTPAPCNLFGPPAARILGWRCIRPRVSSFALHFALFL